MKLAKRIMLSLGFGALAGGYMTLLYMFFSAYFTPTKSAVVMIDHFGEANFELILLAISIPSVIFFCKEYFKKRAK